MDDFGEKIILGFLAFMGIFLVLMLYLAHQEEVPDSPGRVGMELVEMDRGDLMRNIRQNCDWNGSVWLYKREDPPFREYVVCEHANRRGIPGGK